MRLYHFELFFSLFISNATKSHWFKVLLTVIFIYAQLLTLMLAEKRIEKKEAA